MDPTTTPAAKKRGWLPRSATGILLLVLAVAGGGYLAFHYATLGIVTAYTDPSPLELGARELSPAELGQLHGRLADFAHAVRNKKPVAPLVLTGEELTALVAGSPELQRVGGRARLSVADGRVDAELSVPLERMGRPDRWLNGTASFTPAIENGVLTITLQSASVKGQPIPGWIVAQLRKRNLAKQLYEDPIAASLIARLESIEMSDGRITIIPRR